MTEKQNTEALKKARTFSDNKDKIDGFYNGYVQATIDLEKENAELKDALKGKRCNCMTYLNFKDLEKECAKAKEIIKYLCGMVRELNKPNVQLTNINYSLSEAEQFLSEVEK